MQPVIGITITTRQGFIDYYVNAVAKAGGTPVVLPILNDTEALFSAFERLDGIIFTGGTDIDPLAYGEQPMYGLGEVKPHRDRHEFSLLSECVNNYSFPVMGICRGIQLINVHFGGTVYQDLEKQKPEGIMHSLIDRMPLDAPSHSVVVERGSYVHEFIGKERFNVNSFHHQAVKDVGPALRVVSRADDGVVEGVQLDDERFLMAVQWHPEMMAETDENALALFKGFVRRCSL